MYFRHHQEYCGSAIDGYWCQRIEAIGYLTVGTLMAVTLVIPGVDIDMDTTYTCTSET